MLLASALWWIFLYQSNNLGGEKNANWKCMACTVVRWVPWVCGETVLTHPPLLEILTRPLSRVNVSSVHVKLRNGFCCGSVSLKYSDWQAIWRELKLSSSSQIQVDYWLKSVEKYLMLLDIESAIKEGYCVHVICCFMDL